MAFDFPNTPVAGTTYTNAGVAWIYNGYLWRSNSFATPPAIVLPNLSLSPNRITENSLAGTLVGGLSGKTSGSTLSLVDTAGNRFALSGTNIVAGSVTTNYEAATSHTTTVRETLTGAANSPNETVLTIFVDDVDETLPVVTSPATYTVPENTAFSVQLTATKPVVWTRTGGLDAAQFSLTAAGMLTLPAKDFENADDSDHNHSYLVTVRATDALSQSVDFPIAVNITNVLEALLTPLTTSTVPTVVAGSPAGTVVTNITNKSQGSTLTMTSNAGGMFALSGFAIVTTTTPATIGNQSVTIRETHPDAINSPSLTAIPITVTAPAPSPPIITSPATFTVPENTPVSLTLTANEAGTWAITGGSDASLFVIDTSATGAEAFDFEAPEDANHNNIYDVDVTFTSTATGLTASQMLSITISDVVVEGAGGTASLTGSQVLQAVAQSTAVLTRVNVSGAHVMAATAQTFLAISRAGVTGAQVLSSPFQTFTALTQVHLTATQVMATGAQAMSVTTQAHLDGLQVVQSPFQSATISTGLDVPGAPKITSRNIVTVTTNTQFAFPLTANEPVTWAVSPGGGFIDNVHFEIVGNILRWAGNGTRDFNAPADSNADNVYRCDYRATDLASNVTATSLNVTVVAVPDVTAPTITSSPSLSVAENSSFSLILTATEPAWFSIVGGADAAQFQILVAGTLMFLTWVGVGTRDFETPTDANGDNVYQVQVMATDGAGNTSAPQLISITVTDVPGA